MKANLVGTIKPEGPVAIDPVKGQLAIGCGGLLGMGTGYRLYKLDNLTTFKKLPMDWMLPKQLVFNQSGNFLAAAENSGNYYIEGWVYDVTTGKVKMVKLGGPRLLTAAGRGGSDAVSISPNGRFLVLASVQDRAVIFDLHSNKKDENVFEQSQYLEQEKWHDRKFFAWSPDSKIMATVLDRTESGRYVRMRISPQGEDSELSEISIREAFFPDGGTNYFVNDERVGLDFSSDSRLLAAGGGTKKKGVIQIIDVQSNKLLMQSQILPSDVRFLKFTPSGEFLLSGDRNGNLTLWKLQSAGTPELKAIETEKIDGTILALGLAQPRDGLFVAYKRGGSVDVSHISLPDEIN